MSSSGSRKETIFLDEQVNVSTYEASIILTDAHPISNTAKLLYTKFLGKAQLSQKNAWLDMNKSETTIKDVMREWGKANR